MDYVELNYGLAGASYNPHCQLHESIFGEQDLSNYLIGLLENLTLIIMQPIRFDLVPVSMSTVFN